MRRCLLLLCLATSPLPLAAQSSPRATSDSLARAGLALVRSAEARALSTPRYVVGRVFEEAFGMDPAARALRVLDRALELDPGNPRAAAALGRVALLTRERETLEDAAAALDAATSRHPDDAELALAAAEVGLALDRPAHAVRLVRTAATDDASARAVLALALLRSPGSEAEGAKLYFESATHQPTSDRWFDELAVLTDERERIAWRTADPSDRVEWLRTFWEARAALGGVPVEGRLSEHYQRLTLARLSFPRRVRWGAPPHNALVWERAPWPFDDRGLILIRHGMPERVIRTASGDRLPDNESWLYSALDGTPRLYNFMRYGGIGEGAYNEWVLIRDFPCHPDWTADRFAYEPLVRQCNGQSRVRVRKYTRIALETDSDRPDMEVALPVAFGLYRFRATDGRTELVAAAAVPADSILGDALDAEFAVVDTASGAVTRATISARTPRGGAGEARLALAVVAEPVAAVHRLLLRDPARPDRGVFLGGAVEPLDFRADTLMISDLMPALSGAGTGGAIVRGDVAIDPMTEAESAASSFRLYYELYNVAPDADVETTVVVENEVGLLKRIFGGRTRTTLRFRDRADPDGGVLRVLRDVAAELEPGRWRLRVEIAVDGNRVVRETILIAR